MRTSRSSSTSSLQNTYIDATRSRSRSRGRPRKQERPPSRSQQQQQHHHHQQQKQRPASSSRRRSSSHIGLFKTTAGLLAGIGVAALVLHKVWPKGVLHGDEDKDWVAKPRPLKRAKEELRGRSKHRVGPRGEVVYYEEVVPLGPEEWKRFDGRGGGTRQRWEKEVMREGGARPEDMVSYERVRRRKSWDVYPETRSFSRPGSRHERAFEEMPDYVEYRDDRYDGRPRAF